jgi:CubicO group peptidase (beta-lactamase class C family)
MSQVVSDTVFPTAEWAFASPEDVGLDSDKVAAAGESIFTIDKRYGFLVIKHGRIAYEKYLRDADATNPIFSVTKGLGATLIGIAEQKGLLKVTDRIADWLPVHHPDIAPDAEIRHVLNMTAGRAPSGSWWQYNSNCILNSLTGIIWLASGMPPVEFYNEYLKKPLGLGFDWPCNNKGWIQIGSQGPLPVIEATHRDIGKLGLLWLNKGSWDGQEVMRPGYVDEALTPPFPESNGAYGYLWWLNADAGTWRTTGGASGDGKWFPYAASNVFLALGARGKVMIVVPDHELIMVSMGNTDQEQSGNFLGKMMRAVHGLLPQI